MYSLSREEKEEVQAFVDDQLRKGYIRLLSQSFCDTQWRTVMRCGGWKQKTLCGTLTYVQITSSDINCALKNSRGGKSRSRKGIKKGIGLRSFIS